MADMHNSWKFTPLENGEVEVEFTENMDQGLPYLLVNNMLPNGVYQTLGVLQKYFDQDDWKNAKYEFIRE